MISDILTYLDFFEPLPIPKERFSPSFPSSSPSCSASICINDYHGNEYLNPCLSSWYHSSPFLLLSTVAPSSSSNYHRLWRQLVCFPFTFFVRLMVSNFNLLHMHLNKMGLLNAKKHLCLGCLSYLSIFILIVFSCPSKSALLRSMRTNFLKSLLKPLLIFDRIIYITSWAYTW